MLFARLDGSPLSRSSLYHAVRRAGEKAGVSWPVGLHALRHSYATILHQRGVPKEQIRNALGHHSWEFTESVYVHDDSIPSAGVLAGLGVGNGVGNTWANQTRRDRPRRSGRLKIGCPSGRLGSTPSPGIAIS